jgi:hypothetical protein
MTARVSLSAARLATLAAAAALSSGASGCFSPELPAQLACGTAGCPAGLLCRSDGTCGSEALPFVDPALSNLPTDVWDLGSAELVLEGELLINTDDLTIKTRAGDQIATPGVATRAVDQGGTAPKIAVWAARGIRIGAGATVDVVGAAALALVSSADVEIAGTLDLSPTSAPRRAGGPGGFAGGGAANSLGDGAGGGALCPSAAGLSPCGGAGASYGSVGGAGGAYRGAAGASGARYGMSSASPLIGGSGGGAGGISASGITAATGGGGGGALQISARGRIALAATGVLHAGGKGGDGGSGFSGAGAGGGGGGSGGMILLEAGELAIFGSIAANGGAGGAGDDGDRIRSNGGSATASLTPAPGGIEDDGMAGGDGGIRDLPGVAGTGGVSGAGGGGGGVGRVLLRSKAAADVNARVLSPTPAQLVIPSP